MKRKIMLIVNGMFYGDSETKKCLWSAFLLSVFSLGAFLCAAAVRSWIPFGIGIFLAVADYFVIRSFDISDETQFYTKEEQEEEIVEEKETKAGKKKRQNREKKDSIKESDNIPKEKDLKPEQGDRDKPEDALNYTQKDLKKLFYVYKVKKNHKPVIVDYCAKYRISQCPAYAWVHRGQFHLLLLEKEPRRIQIPAEQMKVMRYEPGVPAEQKKEYTMLDGHSLVSVVFRELKPVYHSTIRSNRQVEVKNLYVFGPGMKFTNSSVKALLEILQPEFQVDDEITRSEDYNKYFKQVYTQGILFRDGVVNIKEYQEKVRTILKNMAEAAITPAAVRMTLSDLVQNNLISTDYANYYVQYNRQYRERHTGK